MADAVKLNSPRLRAVRDDGAVFEVQTGNPDLILWDTTARKHRWGDFQESKFTWLTFIAWAAARRTGQIPADYSWEDWKTHVLEIQDADEDETAGTPTEPGPDPG